MTKGYVSQCLIVCSVLDTEAQHQGFSERLGSWRLGGCGRSGGGSLALCTHVWAARGYQLQVRVRIEGRAKPGSFHACLPVPVRHEEGQERERSQQRNKSQRCSPHALLPQPLGRGMHKMGQRSGTFKAMLRYPRA